MGRIYFESVDAVDPADTSTEQVRRRLVPLKAILAVAVLLCVAAGGLAYVQYELTADGDDDRFEAARAVAAREQKHVAILFTQPDCIVCRRLETETLNDPGIRAMLDRRFVILEVDPDGSSEGQEMASRFGAETAPFIALAAASGEPLRAADGAPRGAGGYLDAEQLRSLLMGARRTDDRPLRTRGETPTVARTPPAAAPTP